MAEETESELDRFGKTLVSLVRDKAIASCDNLIQGKTLGPYGGRWKAAIQNRGIQEALAELMPDVVDQVIFCLLDAIDNEQFAFLWRTSDGRIQNFDDLGKGEIAGWFMGSPGWRHKFSSQRFFDPFADL